MNAIRSRSILMASLVIFSGISAFGQTLTVTHPGNVALEKGELVTITWEKTGSMLSRVKIRLMKGNGGIEDKVLFIEEDTENDGSYEWRVPVTLPVGMYLIRVKTIDNLVGDDGDFFGVVARADSLAITGPENETVEKGELVTITWEKTGSMLSRVKIRLMKGNGGLDDKVLFISDDTENDGSYTWEVPVTLPVGMYLIRVKTIDNLIGDDGDFFEVVAGDDSIAVTGPENMTVEKGELVTITWDKTGSMLSRVKIRLMKGNGRLEDRILFIEEDIENDGSYEWEVPVTLPVGMYLIRVKTIDNLIGDDGDFFEVVARDDSIAVTGPENMTVKKGEQVTITWDKTGSMLSRAKIRLMRGNGGLDDKVLFIDDDTENDGSYEWMIPVTLPVGMYLIRVKTIDNLIGDDGGFFEVTAGIDSIAVTGPENTTVKTGELTNITWTKTGSMNEMVEILLMNGNGESEDEVLMIAEEAENIGEHSWQVPFTIAEGDYLVRVRTIDGMVGDDGDFFAVNQGIEVVYPTADSTLYENQRTTIRWSKPKDIGENVEISLVTNDGKDASNAVAMTIKSCMENTGQYPWNLKYVEPCMNPCHEPCAESEQYMIRVKTLDGSHEDYSALFEIRQKECHTMNFVEPNEYSAWELGETVNIRWNPVKFIIPEENISQRVRIKLYKAGSEDSITVADRIVNLGLWSWQVPNDLLAGTYYLKMVRIDFEYVEASGRLIREVVEWDEYFSEEFSVIDNDRRIDVLAPVDDILEAGETHEIQWSSTNIDGEVKIRLMWNFNGETEEELGKYQILKITDSTLNTGAYSWKVPHYLADGTYCIRVTCTDANGDEVGDDGEYFGIVNSKGIRVTWPAAGARWSRGDEIPIRWAARGDVGNQVRIRLMRGSDLVQSVVEPTDNDGEHLWVVPNGVEPGNYLINIQTMDNLFEDDGDMFYIGIDDPGITVISPSFTTIVGAGESKIIRWTSSGLGESQVKIQLMKGNATDLVEEISAGTDNDGEYEWTVTEGIEAGEYLMRVKTVDNLFDDDGEVFEINNGSDFVWWSIGDTHVHALNCNEVAHEDEYSLLNALSDAEVGGNEGGESFEWNLATLVGDYVGKGDVPNELNGEKWLAQYDPASTSYRPYMFYGVIGNHDAGAGENLWFKQYVDPLGQYPTISGVTNEHRPYEVSADSEWDHYSFQVGNILYLMLSDRNEGIEPFGRVEPLTNSSFRGHGAARFTRATYEWWKDKVENNQDKIIVTVTHNAPANTTVHTGLLEPTLFGTIYDFPVHYGFTWADRNGGGMIYGIDSSESEDYVTIGIDGSIDNGNNTFINGGERDYGFLKYLEENPGAIDIWVHGHTHSAIRPTIYYNGKTDTEKKFGVWFINAGAVNMKHSPAQVLFSRVFQFFDGSNRVIMKTYLHSGNLMYSGAEGESRVYWLENNNGWMQNQTEGFFDPAQRVFTLNQVFSNE